MEIVFLFLIILWFLGYLTIPGLIIPRFPLFYIKGHPINLWDIFIFLLVLYAIDETPSPFREVFITLLILWLLSTFGIVALVGFSHILVLALIFALFLSLVEGRQKKL